MKILALLVGCSASAIAFASDYNFYNIGNLGTGATPEISFSVPRFADTTGAVYGQSTRYVGGVNLGIQGYKWTSSTGINALGHLGTATNGYTTSRPGGMLDSSTLCGDASLFQGGDDKGLRATYWQNGTATHLGTLSTSLTGKGYSSISFGSTSRIYGTYRTYSGNSETGTNTFIWTPGGGMKSVNPLSLGASGGGISKPITATPSGRLYGTYSKYTSTGGPAGTFSYVHTDQGGVRDLGNLGTDSQGRGETHVKGTRNGLAFGSARSYAAGANRGYRAFVETAGGTISSLNTLGMASNGLAAAEATFLGGDGYIYGFSTLYQSGFSRGSRAVRWSQSGVIENLGSLGTTATGSGVSKATFMDPLGRVIGTSAKIVGASSFGNHAFVWSPSEGMIDLGHIAPSTAGVSNANPLAADGLGNVFGMVDTYNGASFLGQVPFMWHKTTGMKKLQDVIGANIPNGITLVSITGVSSGYILGEAIAGDGSRISYAIKPFGVAAVPEPGTILALAAGVGLLARKRRKK
jgi:probable HAF family extracellular repeat protein